MTLCERAQNKADDNFVRTEKAVHAPTRAVRILQVTPAARSRRPKNLMVSQFAAGILFQIRQGIHRAAS